jgi:ribosomal protein S18 acetylase RimI-like enzyme
LVSGLLSIRRLDDPTDLEIKQLSDVLIDCVDGGASVNFMHSLSAVKANAFWQGVADDVRSGKRLLLVGEDELNIAGTVQLVLEQPENQPHRADVVKMLVHRRARNRGIGLALMRAVEAAAQTAGKTLLMLDTVTGDAGERLYRRAGWTFVGDIPNYALLPRGGLCGTSVFYLKLG